MSETAEKLCFVISPIGTDGSETRKRADRIFNHVISPVAQECGYRALRADHISEPGIITSQVIQHILEDPMVVADLTGDNANVFYELAVRHAIRKPYVQIIKLGDKIPFDVTGVRTIEIDHTDLESVAAAKEAMKKQMRFAEANPDKIQSPLSVAVDFAKLLDSSDPLHRQIGDLVELVSDLKRTITSDHQDLKKFFRTQDKAKRDEERRSRTMRQKTVSAVEKLDENQTNKIIDALKKSLAKARAEPAPRGIDDPNIAVMDDFEGIDT